MSDGDGQKMREEMREEMRVVELREESVAGPRVVVAGLGKMLRWLHAWACDAGGRVILRGNETARYTECQCEGST